MNVQRSISGAPDIITGAAFHFDDHHDGLEKTSFPSNGSGNPAVPIGDRRLCAYSAADLRLARNAFKLAVKFLRPENGRWGRPETALSAHAAEMGLAAAFSGGSVETVAAAFFYPAFIKAGPEQRKVFESEVLRKFGSGTVSHVRSAIELGRDALQTSVAGETYQYDLQGIDSGTADDASQLRYLLSACRYAADLYGDAMRRWGPTEKLPLLWHALETGLMLIMSDGDALTVAGGILHDAREGYVVGISDRVSREIVEQFGSNVARLVDTVSEPRENDFPPAWALRKKAVFDRVAAGDQRAACIACASKISTLAAGNKWLWEGGHFEHWSKGTLEQNLDLADQYMHLFAVKGVPLVLLAALREELDRLQGWLRPSFRP